MCFIKNDNNSWIVLGRDRPAARDSGYGGRGHTGASSIDLCAGRKLATTDGLNYDPNMQKDAARIYISQKTDVDRNFDIASGETEDSRTRSAIGIKADAIRIMSRENMKLVAGMDKNNSQGGDIEKAKFGVSLIANNDDSDMQPIAKGNNLADCLRDVYKKIHKLNGILNGILAAQDNFNKALKDHRHLSPFKGKVTSRSPSLKFVGSQTIARHASKSSVSLKLQRTNIVNSEEKYLKNSGPKYINSRNNKVN